MIDYFSVQRNKNGFTMEVTEFNPTGDSSFDETTWVFTSAAKLKKAIAVLLKDEETTND